MSTPGAYVGGSGYAPRPRIRFEVIGEAWQLFQQQMGTWILASLISMAVMACVIGPFYIFIFAAAFATARAGHQPGAFAAGPIPSLLFDVIIMFVVNFLLGGMYRMALKQIRGEPISAGDIFSAVDVIGNLAAAAFLIPIATWFGIFGCCIGIFVVAGLLMFTIPLVVDRRVNAVEAMGASWNALKGEWAMAAVFYFVISIVGSIGWVGCCVGILFTYPLIPLSIGLLYRDFFMAPGDPGPYVPPPPVPEQPAAYAPPAAEAPPPPPAHDPPTAATAEAPVESAPRTPVEETASSPPASPPTPTNSGPHA